MSTVTVRINETDHVILAELARAKSQTMSATLSEAIKALNRQDLLRRTGEAYARLRQDPEAWAEMMQERALWETTLADGLE